MHPIGSIDVEITPRCNLSCEYCYLGLGKNPIKADMSEETIEDVLTLLQRFGIKTKFNGKDKDPTVRFYGGEPLMNFKGMKHFVERAKERNIPLCYTCFSNGTITTQEIVDWFRENNVGIQRSIDGCKEAQDKSRPFSFELYEKGTALFKDYGSVRRMTITPTTVGYIFKSVLDFEERGQTGGFDAQPDFYVEWTDKDIAVYIDQMTKVANHFIKRFKEGKPFYINFMHKDATYRFGMPTQACEMGCKACIMFCGVSYDGLIVPCARFTRIAKDDPFAYGMIKDVLEDKAKGYDKVVMDRVSRCEKQIWNDECKWCIARNACEKGCLHSNWVCNKDTNKPAKIWCATRRMNAEMAMFIDSELRTIDPNWWHKANYRGEFKNWANKKGIKINQRQVFG